jgi:enamine deaminase RidA (YjgF/YER057c/UK114 family)
MITRRLAELGFRLQPAPLMVLDRFHVATRHGDLVYTSGQVSDLDGEAVRGKVGRDINVATARRAAQLCTVNCLRAVAAVSDVDRIDSIVKIIGMVNVADGFTDTASVINGCSEMLVDVFGEAGYSHARSAVGMAVLAQDYSVEIEMIVAVRP